MSNEKLAEEDVDAWDDGSPIEDIHHDLPTSQPAATPSLVEGRHQEPSAPQLAAIQSSIGDTRQQPPASEPTSISLPQPSQPQLQSFEKEEDDVDAWDDGTPIEHVHDGLQPSKTAVISPPEPLQPTSQGHVKADDDRFPIEEAYEKAQASEPAATPWQQHSHPQAQIFEQENVNAWDVGLPVADAHHELQPVDPAAIPSPQSTQPSSQGDFEQDVDVRNDELAIEETQVQQEPPSFEKAAMPQVERPEPQSQTFTKGHRKRFSTSQVFSQDSNDDFFSSIKPEVIAEDEEAPEANIAQEDMRQKMGAVTAPREEGLAGASQNAVPALQEITQQPQSPQPQSQTFNKGHRKRFSTSQVFSQGSNDDFFSAIKPEAIEEDDETSEANNAQEAREPTEEELAAKWEAEMAAAGLLDELMDDDDDLLPDDAAPNAPAQDDGFLDDELMDDDFLPETPAEIQQAQAPVPNTRSTNPYAPQAPAQNPASHSMSASSTNPYAPQPGQQRSPVNPYFPSAPAQQRPSSSGNTYTPAGGAPPPNPYLNPAAGVPPVAAIQSVQESLQKMPERPAQNKAQSFLTASRKGYESPYDLPLDLAPKKKPSSRKLVSHFPPQAPQVPNAPPIAPPQSAPPRKAPQQHMAPPLNSAIPPLGMASAPRPGASLVAPPPVSPYAPLQPPSAPFAAPATKRYSPAPTQQISHAAHGLVGPPSESSHTPLQPPQAPFAAPATKRYSPVPTQQASHQAQGGLVVPPPASPYTQIQTHEMRAAPPTKRYSPAHNLAAPQTAPSRAQYSPAPTQQAPNAAPGRASLTAPPSAARRAMSYAPKNREPLPEEDEPPFEAPQRSQTQSPGSAMNGRRPNLSEPYVRPTSVQSNAKSPERVRRAHASIPEVPVTKARGRAFSQTFNYIAPTDGREQDPLQRWRGGPVFAWGVAGTVITTFPKEVPRYSMGSTVPMIQPSPGEVKIRNIKDIYPLEGPAANFPGPLKGKGKKKEVVAWLSAGIEALEKEQESSSFGYQASDSVDDKRKDERIVLWKVLRVLVDNDGMLEGKPETVKATRDILAPDVSGANASEGPQHITDFSSTGITRFSGGTPMAEPVDPVALDNVKKYLLTGDREKAVWEAVDHRLWAHAMLIGSTLSPDIYKKVAQEFIQKEIKQIGDNTESLAMLYEVFAGNHEESIDELVTPSARAGLQMLNTSGAGSSKSVQEGLDRWRESLGLILSNRTVGDNVAIHSLGKLLASYDRPEAAHICFLFARSISLFAGVDNENTDIVLVGADHKRSPFDFDKNLESIELTEVYEYGLSLAATSNVPVQVPHLAAYKLQHAKILASFGLRTRALDYCESIANLITSQTKRSPYHNTSFMSELDDLIQRLKQSPNDQATGLFAKPTMSKVSSSVWTKFNNFVAGGDDEDEKSEGAGGVQQGPFAGAAGSNGTPTISRTPSVDHFGNMAHTQSMGGMGLGMPQMGSMPIPTTKAGGRYAPGGGGSAASSYNPQNHLLPAFGSYNSQQSGAGFGQHQQIPPFRGQSATPDLDNRAVSRGSQPGRYAPVNAGSARTSLDQGARPSFEERESGNYSRRSSTRPSEEDDRRGSVTAPPAVNPYAYQGYTPYAPQANSFETPPAQSYQPAKGRKSEDGGNGGYNPPQNSYAPHHESPLSYNEQNEETYQPQREYNPPEDSCAPPEHTRGYTPPAYEPNSIGDVTSSPEDGKRTKKKMFGDDEEDDWGMPKPKKEGGDGGKGKEKTKAEKDKEADEAFRRAAEEDGELYPATIPLLGPSERIEEDERYTNKYLAKRAEAEAPKKKGWGLGGWFRKGSMDSTPASSPQSQPGKPIRAKLGEESSFYYDPDLKRWVNKKASKEEQAKASATPPPPKGPPRQNTAPPGASGHAGPPRTSSVPPPLPTAMGGNFAQPPSSQPSRQGSPAVGTPPNMATPPMRHDSGALGANLAPPMQRSVSALSHGSDGSGTSTGPPGSSGPGSAPPSRPSTGVLGNKSTIDDLIGPAVPRKRGEGGKKKRAGRYIDVMADKTGGAGGA